MKQKGVPVTALELGEAALRGERTPPPHIAEGVGAEIGRALVRRGVAEQRNGGFALVQKTASSRCPNSPSIAARLQYDN
jgi:hypothetical protein